MDVDETYARIVRAIEVCNRSREQASAADERSHFGQARRHHEEADDAARDVVDLFGDLDGILKIGGYLPRAWRDRTAPPSSA